MSSRVLRYNFNKISSIIVFVIFYNFIFCISEYPVIAKEQNAFGVSLHGRKLLESDGFGKAFGVRFNSKFLNLYFFRSQAESYNYTNSYSLGHIHPLNNNIFVEFVLSYRDYPLSNSDYIKGPSRTYYISYVAYYKGKRNFELITHTNYSYVDRKDSYSEYISFLIERIYTFKNFTIEPNFKITKQIDYGISLSLGLAMRYIYVL